MSFDKDKVEEYYPEAGELMIEPMKIWKLPEGKQDMLSDVCTSNKYFLEEKIDGAFYQFVKTENYSYLFGRTKSVKTGLLTEKSSNVPHIIEALSCIPAGTVIIGEIYYPGKTSKDVTRIMGCLPNEARRRQENNPIHYYLHDIIKYEGTDLINEGAEYRYDILQALFRKYNLEQYDFLRLAEKVDADLETKISNILRAGGEGAVLKKRDAVYSPDKRPAWDTIKIKQMDSIDLVCMGFCPPTKEYTGKEIETWPYWESANGQKISSPEESAIPVTKYYYYNWNTAIRIGAYDDSGQLLELGTVSSGLTDEIKKDMTEHPESYLNKVCVLDCMSINKKDKTLRHPVFKCWREDKNAEDCIINEIFV